MNTVSNDYETSEYKKRADTRIGNECYGLGGTAAFECKNGIEQSTRDAHRSQKDLKAQRYMALWAFIMAISSIVGAIFTLIGIVFIKLTLDETKRAVDSADGAVEATKEIGEVQSRAYVLVEEFDFLFNEEDQTKIAVDVRIKNNGNTPALNVEINSLVSFIESRAHGVEIPVLEPLLNPSIVNLAAGSETKTRTYCP